MVDMFPMGQDPDPELGNDDLDPGGNLYRDKLSSYKTTNLIQTQQ